MKRFILLVTVLSGISITAWYFFSSKSDIVSPLPSPSAALYSPSPSPILGLVDQENSLIPLQLLDTSFRVGWTEVDATKIRVGINPNLASSSSELASRSGCVVLTNAAFYGVDGDPLGLLVSDKNELVPWKKNTLFNGVIGFDSDDQEVILETGEPTRSYLWAVQAGPILWQEGEPAILSLKNDQSARRVVAAITSEHTLVVAVIVANDSLFGGPQLVQMADVISAWQAASGLQFESVLNLDGGTASAYISPTLTLKELKAIGSYLCEKR